MSGLGTTPWTLEDYVAYDAALDAAGWHVEHCGHCDRSNRHPSCLIQPIPGREQEPLPPHPHHATPQAGEEPG